MINSALKPSSAVVPLRRAYFHRTSPLTTRITTQCQQQEQKQKDLKNLNINDEILKASMVILPVVLMAEPALAVKGELGLLEGRTLALIHPAIMAFLFVSTGYAGYLGWQWRSVRTIGEDITILKSQRIAPAEGETPVASPLDTEISRLQDVRKTLIKGNFKDRHFNWGSLLLGLGVLIAIEGPVNTYIRTGKLFPGPHLYAGAGIVCLWAAAAAMVPYMQKGSDTARSIHIGLNALNLALFAWQIPTGLEIVGKVFQFTTWP